MRFRRLRTLAMAVATIGVATLGLSGTAVADILLTLTDGANAPVTFETANNNLMNQAFSLGSYTGSISVVITNFPGVTGTGSISTNVSVGTLTSTTPEDLKVQVQLVNPVGQTNLLWTSPNGTPVNVSAASSLAASGDTNGQVTTSTFFNSTTSTTTTGLGAATTTATLANGSTGVTNTGIPNPAGTYTLSQTVLLHGLTVPAGGTLAPVFGGTATVTGPTRTAVPEPSSLAIAGLGALGMIGYGLRRRKAMGV